MNPIWVISLADKTMGALGRLVTVAALTSCSVALHVGGFGALDVTEPKDGQIINASSSTGLQVSGPCAAIGGTVEIVNVKTGAIVKAVCENGSYSAAMDVADTDDGELPVEVRLLSKTGTTIKSARRVLKKDVLPPQFLVTSPVDNAWVSSLNQSNFMLNGPCAEQGTVEMRLNGEISQLGSCSDLSWTAQRNFSSLTDGTNLVSFRQIDPAGNPSDWITRTIRKDVQAGSVGVDNPPIDGTDINGAISSALGVSLTCSEAGQPLVLSGLVNMVMSCPGGTFATMINVTAAPDSPNALLIVSHLDEAGNVATSVRSFNKDTVPPSVAINSPAANTEGVTGLLIGGICENGLPVNLGGAGLASPSSTTCASNSFSVMVNFTAGDGSKVITVSQTDLVGNTASDSRTFLRDSSAPGSPTINIEGGAPAINTPTVTLTLGVSGATEMYITNTAGCSVGGSWEAYNPTKSAWPLSATNATNTVYVKYKDSLGNETACVNDSIVHDDIAPTGTSIVIAGGATYVNSLSVNLTLAATGADQMYVTVIPGCTLGGSWEAYNTTKITTLAASNTTNNVYVKFRDLALNESSCVTDSVIHDSVVPTVAITSPAAGTLVTTGNQASFTISGTCSENGRTVSISGAASASPTCTAGLTWTTNLNLTAAPQGALILYANHSDAAGNAAVQDSRSFTKDTVAPSWASPGLSIAASQFASLTTSPNVTWSNNATDAGSGIQKYQYAVGTSAGGTNTLGWTDVAVSPFAATGMSLTDGTTYYVTMRVLDNVGFTTSTGSVSWRADVSGPTVSTFLINSGATWTNNDNVTLTIAASDPSTVTHMYITNTAGCASGGSWVVYSGSSGWTLGSLNTATSTVYIKARDSLFNESGCVSDTIGHDSVAPTVAITSPAAGASVTAGNQASFTVSGTCSENGRTVAISGAASASPTCTAGLTWTTNLNLTAVAQGSLTIYANHTDAAGNAAVQDSRSFTKDTVAPSWASPGLSISNAYSSSTSASPVVTYLSNATDVSGILKYQYCVGVSAGTCGTVAWTDVGSTSFSAPGTYTHTTMYYVSMRVFDNHSNITTHGTSVSWRVDTTAPTGSVAITTLNNGRTFDTQQVTVNLVDTVTDVHSGLISTQYSLGTSSGGADVVNWTNTTFSPSFSITGLNLNPGRIYYINFRATNGAGISTISFSAQITVLSSAQSLSLGNGFACSIANETTKCWGANYSGMIGDGTLVNKNTPTQAVGLTTGMSAVSSGGTHNCAIRNGSVKCWGENTYGQLGDNSSTNRSSPANVSGLSGGVTRLSAGASHTCAIQNGAAKCWGYNQYGQLGDGTNVNKLIPTQVSGLTSGVSEIVTGLDFTCAIQNGSAKCWGRNVYGQLGNSTNTNSNVAVSVTGLSTNVTQLTAGDGHACAIHGGAAKCWGDNSLGALGNSTNTNSNFPVSVTGLSANLSKIIATRNSSCALSNGAIQCWGYNGYGSLGDGTFVDRNSPVNIAGTNTNYINLFSGNSITICAQQNEKYLCWGNNSNGIIDPLLSANLNTPSLMAYTGALTIKVKSGDNYSCLLVSGALKCTGLNSNGSLGTGNTTAVIGNLASVVGMNEGVSDFDIGITHTCAVQNGAAKCWGSNGFSQLGNGDTTQQSSPVGVVGFSSGVTKIFTGDDHTCLVKNSNLHCWGKNDYGMLGDGNSGSYRSNPYTNATMSGGVTDASLAGSVTCFIKGGMGVCVGFNYFGQMGNGASYYGDGLFHTPIGLSSGVEKIAVKDTRVCAIVNGATYCWGDTLLGDGTTNLSYTPVLVPGLSSNTAQLSLGYQHTCVLSDGSPKCWGSNSLGQLGTGDTVAYLAPTPYGGVSDLTFLFSGFNNIYYVKNGLISGTGANSWNELGVLPAPPWSFSNPVAWSYNYIPY